MRISDLILHYYYRGWTVLHLAARHSKPQTVRRLLDQVTKLLYRTHLTYVHDGISPMVPKKYTGCHLTQRICRGPYICN